MLAGSDLRYRREGRVVLDGASITVAAGEAVAVTGPSGSGKSTLLALLAGLEPPDGGRVERRVDPSRIGMVLQGHGLISLLTAEENVALPLQARGRELSKAAIRRRSRAALDAVRLGEVATHLMEALSGGQQQRVAVARALVVDPAVLLADEVTASLDAETRGLVVDLLLARVAAGMSLVLATHDLRLAARADRVIRIEQGRLVELGRLVEG
ncbi:ABC transporter ATP-binding protein [uncultured Amnibacterium sp.]|uniref:ABC transporter ATP-binding protein n=1 Tax=uncultured Amnibacterium sp. TaxID=1631851 RepID=UPI0035CAA7B5